ncbi:MAG: sigma-70 family RNA polymerase sigma factor [Clostridia bacterium]|nr:sigma-70 family RNA polymerase sigma factor [Clostridia bacterium]
MLSNEETLNLLKLAQSGNDNAKEILITENSPLIKSVIRRYKNKGVEDEDLYQLGCMGFVKAINNFSAEYNVKFSTYAVPMIAGEVKRFLRDDGSVKVSRSIKHNAILIKNYITEYQSKIGVEPSIDQISNEFNIDPQDVVLTLEASTQLISIDDKFDDEDDSLAERTQDNFSPDKLVDKIVLRDMINALPAREKRVIIMRYYLDKTQSEIASSLGVSQVQISRIENKILQNFKEMIK